MKPLDSIAAPVVSPWAGPPVAPSADLVIFLACYACGGKLRLKRKHLGVAGACVFCRVPLVAWERADAAGSPAYFSEPPPVEAAPLLPAVLPPASLETLHGPPAPASTSPPFSASCPPFAIPGTLDPAGRVPGWEPQPPAQTGSAEDAASTEAPATGMVPAPEAVKWSAVEFPSSHRARERASWGHWILLLAVVGGLSGFLWSKWSDIIPVVKEWLMPAQLSSPYSGLEPPTPGPQPGVVVTRPYVLDLSPGFSPEQVLETAGRKLLERFYLGGSITERMASVIPAPGVETAMTNYYARFTEMPVLGGAQWVGRMKDPGSSLWFGVFDVKESTSDRDFRWCVVEVAPGRFLLDWELHQQLADDLLGRFMGDNGATDADLTLILRRGVELKDEDNPWKPDTGVEVYLSLPLSKDRSMPQRVVLPKESFARMGFEEKLVGNTTRIARVRMGWVDSPHDRLIRYPIIEECYSWGAWDSKVANQVMAQSQNRAP